MSEALALFARFPRRGQVKTRLAADIGDHAALQLYEAFLLDSIDRLSRLPLRLFLFLADSTPEENRKLARKHDFPRTLSVRSQSGRDLGQRLWNAYVELARTHSRVVFMGADSPTLPLSHIASAYRQLKDHPVVLGPVADGGYYLVGLAEPVPEIFEHISWGTSAVLAQTRRRLGDRSVAELAGWYDVDTAEDLKKLWVDLPRCDPPLERTRRVLTGWGAGPEQPFPEAGDASARPGSGARRS